LDEWRKRFNLEEGLNQRMTPLLSEPNAGVIFWHIGQEEGEPS